MSLMRYLILKGEPYKKEEYPTPTSPNPLIKDYSAGYFTRYFIQPKQDLSDIIEVDVKQYDSYSKLTGINANFYNAIKMKWRLRGQAYDTYKKGVRIIPGVWHGNKRIAQLKEQHMPGISQKIVDYIKFAAITQNVENPSGITSEQSGHSHMYVVDEQGNGWALESANPKNPNIKHNHEIVNWVVGESQSNCYPNCKMIYGHKGSGPHTHRLKTQKDIEFLSS
jgi:hypothetical protein